MPQTNAILDCSPIAAAGHVIPQRYGPVSVSQFMDDLSAEEDVLCTHLDKDNNCVSLVLFFGRNTVKTWISCHNKPWRRCIV